MNIQGLQKMTLLDFPTKTACTIFTGGCNFLCPFCHNASLVLSSRENEAMLTSDFFAFLEKRKGKLDGVCISGGEPLLQPDLLPFIQKIRSLGFLVKLDTNGSSPEKLSLLLEEKLLDYVAMDIKNSPQKYSTTIGIPNYDLTPIKESAVLLINSDIAYEFRTTVIQEFHEAEDFKDIGRWIQGATQYYLQAFVDSGNLIQNGLHGCSKEALLSYADAVRPFVPSVQTRGV